MSALRLFAALILAAAVLTGCAERPDDPVIIAKIADEPVTLAEFDAWLEFEGHDISAESRARRFDAFIDHRVHLAEARRRGLHDNPRMHHRFERMLAQSVRADIEDALPPPAAPPEDELRARYEADPRTFRVPARVRPAIILVEAPASMDPAARDARRETALALRAELEALPSENRPRRFAELAVRHSAHQPTRHHGGDLGWWIEGTDMPEWPDTVVDAAFALNAPGALGPVLETEAGFALLLLTARDDARRRPFEDVRPRLAREWLRDTRRAAETEARETLRQRHNAELRPDRLEEAGGP